MRAILVGTGVCMTAAVFFAAERMYSSAQRTLELEQQSSIQAAAAQQVQASEARMQAETVALQQAKQDAQSQVLKLNKTIADLSAKEQEFAVALQAEVSKSAATKQSLLELEALHSGMVQRVELQTVSLSDKDAELMDLRTQIEANALQAQGTQPQELDATLQAEIASLAETLATRNQTIASLQTELSKAKTAKDEAFQPNLVLERELELARNEIETLTGKLSMQADEAEQTVSDLTASLRAQELRVTDLKAQLDVQNVTAETAVVAGDTEDQAGQVELLAAQLSKLQEIVDSQTYTISNLRMGFDEETSSSSEMAEVCIERANKIFEISQIKFATSTASISDDSKTVLDHLRDLAIGCESDDMYIEIGGHTDSQGSEDDNQRLSEARANSVRSFLIARGIPDDTMVAVGYGELQPIAPNSTVAGRAQNRRITFTWQMRDDTSASVVQ